MTKIGSIGWIDLTVEDAAQVSDFYCQVVGWERSSVPQDGYDDYCVHPPGDESPAAGICHARGPNASIPPQWLIYVIVADVQSSVEACERLGGKIVVANRDMGSYGTLAIIQDPAGATLALMQPPADD